MLKNLRRSLMQYRKNKNIITTILLVIVLSITQYLSPVTMLFAGYGTTTANFLKIGIGARPCGMGEAFTAVSDDVSAIYWNPAGLAGINLSELSFMHTNWVEGINYQFAGYAFPIRVFAKKKPEERYPQIKANYGSLGLGISSLSMGKIQGYYGAETPELEGTKSQELDVSDLAIIISYAKQLYGFIGEYQHKLYAGGNIKFINKKLAYKTANTIAIDAAVLFKPTWNIYTGKLQLGLNVRNISSGMTFEKESSALPLDLCPAIAYFRNILGNDFIFSTDYSYASNSINIGTEYPFWDIVSIRFGYKISSHLDRGVRAGIGFGTRNIKFDYAYSPFDFLGQIHRFNVNLRFGRKPLTIEMVQEIIKNHYQNGYKYYQKDMLVEAYKEFKAVLSLEPTHIDAIKKIAEIELAFKEFKDQLQAAKRRQEIDKQIAVAKEYFNKGDLIKAKEQFNIVLELEPANTVAKDFLQKIEKAYAAMLEEQVKELFAAGQMLYDKAKYVDAQELFKKIIELKPEHKEAKLYLDKCKEKIIQIEEERRKEEEKKKYAKEKEKIDTLYKKSIMLYNKQKWQEAIKGFEEVIKFDTQNKECQEYLTKAKQAWQKQQEVNRAKAEELYTEGLKAYTAGDIKKAQELWEQVLKLNPEHTKAQKGLERIKLEKK